MAFENCQVLVVRLQLFFWGFTLGFSTCMQSPELKTLLVQDRLFPEMNQPNNKECHFPKRLSEMQKDGDAGDAVSANYFLSLPAIFCAVLHSYVGFLQYFAN